MKIGFSSIIKDHIKTLQNAKNGRISIVDISVFYGVPYTFSILVYLDKFKFSNELFSQSIAVFSIFSALLFSVQVALFGIYTKKREEVDEYSEAFSKERLEARRVLVRETNANISYLIVLSLLSVTIFLTAFALDFSDRFEPALAVFLYLHFVLTLLMIVKRVHALFDKEYRLDMM